MPMFFNIWRINLVHQIFRILNGGVACRITDRLKLKGFSSSFNIPAVSLNLNEHNVSFVINSREITDAALSVPDLLADNQHGLLFIAYHVDILAQQLFDITFFTSNIRECR